jgi:ribosomal protein S12 methylthiotransferase accessory factor YcaO
MACFAESIERDPRFRAQDALRLVGLSRIPRCSNCPRLEALTRAYESPGEPPAPWPAPPRNCRHVVCAALARRFAGSGDARQ